MHGRTQLADRGRSGPAGALALDDQKPKTPLPLCRDETIGLPSRVRSHLWYHDCRGAWQRRGLVTEQVVKIDRIVHRRAYWNLRAEPGLRIAQGAADAQCL
jgi:hypothetical protein